MPTVLYDVRNFSSVIFPPVVPTVLGALIIATGVLLYFATGIGRKLLFSFGLVVIPGIRRMNNGKLLTAGRVDTAEGGAHISHDPNLKEETLEIDGRIFKYSPYSTTGGFSYAAFSGGPLRDGDRLKIQFTGDDIVRIERLAPLSK